MKTLIAVVVLCTFMVLGCDNKSEQLQQQVAQLESEKTSLEQTITDREKYIEEVMLAVNEVYKDLETARAKEASVVERAGGAEGPVQVTTDTRQSLLSNINEIGNSLSESRKKIADLQKRTKAFSGQVAGLNKLIENLKQSLQEREASIAALETRVQGLEATVAEKTMVIQAREETINQQQKRMNTVYYVAGTRDELTRKGIIRDEGGFLWGLLGSTTVMASGLDLSHFTPLDKTTDYTISVNGEVDEILPHRNEEFYAVAMHGESQSEITIMTPEKFWQDNYLIVVLD